jgi:tRNA G18 (ribose-2'-O)-methylase SpoU
VYEDKCILIIGNEGNGISQEVLDVCSHKVYIPMFGEVESLNASIAGGILMFEMQKSLLS